VVQGHGPGPLRRLSRGRRPRSRPAPTLRATEVLRPYLTELAGALERELREELVAVWLFGSAALGDFDASRSDVDVQAVTATRLPRERRERVAEALTALACPVRGLEFVLYAREDLDAAAYGLNLNTGPRMPYHASFDADQDPRFWFVLDLAIGREHGRALRGPEPAELLEPPPPARVAEHALLAIQWWSAAGLPAQTILAAARSWAWASGGSWLSKDDGAEWAAAQLSDPGPVRRARAARDGGEEPGAEDVLAVVEPARAALSRRVRPRPGE
jgi:hypothetical protein